VRQVSEMRKGVHMKKFQSEHIPSLPGGKRQGSRKDDTSKRNQNK
jgi:hypothetical protein